MNWARSAQIRLCLFTFGLIMMLRSTTYHKQSKVSNEPI